MRKSQELLIKLSEMRGQLSETMEKRAALADADAVPDDIRDRIHSLPSQIRDIEAEYRAAATLEAREDEAVLHGDGDAGQREFSGLERRCSVVSYLAEAATGSRLAGAEAEYRSEILGSDADLGMMPLRMLADRPATGAREDRAVTPVADAATGIGSQSEILGRVFPRSLMAYLGVGMPSVPMGSRTYPILSTGSTVSQQSKSGAQAATAGVFTGHTLAPVRATGSYEFRIEDVQLLRGLEDALRRDLRAGISDHMEQQVLTGNGTAPNVSGFYDELPAPTDATARAGHDDFLNAVTDGVDGRGAYEESDIRMVVGTDTFARMSSQYRGNSSDDHALAHIRTLGTQVRVSQHVPAVAAKDQIALLVRTAFPTMYAVAPVWEGVQMIRDMYSLATQGEVRITMIALWNFKLLRPAAAYLRDFQITA